MPRVNQTAARLAAMLAILAPAASRAGQSPVPRRPAATTTITLAKSGNNIAFAWVPAGGQTYDATRATNQAFFNAVTLFSGNTSGSYAYLGGLVNSRTSEFFDITDQTEMNAGAVNNGGTLPPVPPTVNAPPAATLFIGQTGAIVTGTEFSAVAPDNGVWFPGGILAHAKTVNGPRTQLTLDIPPGALSGRLSVSRQNAISSDPVNADVHLEDPALVAPDNWTAIRTIGFANGTGDYWMAGAVNGVNGTFRQYYDTTTKKWLKENRSGTFAGTLVCSTQSDRFGRIYCAVNSNATSSVATRFAQTNPAADLSNCRGLSGLPFSNATDTVRGLAIAADPNPGAVAGRDMVYVIGENSTLLRTYILKMGVDATGCISTLDRDYGNKGGGGWSTVGNPGGLGVDRDGNVYIVHGAGVVERIALDESRTVVKSGLSSVRGIDVRQEVSGGPVFFLTTEFSATAGVSKVNWFASDSPAAPRVLRTGTSIRAVAWGATVIGPATSLTVPAGKAPEIPVVLLRQNTVISNNVNALPQDPDPRMDVTPDTIENGRGWLSSPGDDPNDKGERQSNVRFSSTGGPTDYSTIQVRAQFKDNIPRLVCARSADPESSAAYEPDPTTPQNCGRAWNDVNAACDNKEPFAASGSGSFMEGGAVEFCPALPCGDSANPCRVLLRISQRYAGDNYRVLFHMANDPEKRVIGSSGPITAWKHQHIERAATCDRGALFYRDYGATGQCGGAGQPACCGIGAEPACNTLRVFSTTTLVNGDTVRVFSEAAGKRYVNGEVRTIVGNPVDSGLGYSTITLDSPLAQSYFATNLDGSNLLPIFTNEHAAGACFTGATLFSADISNIQGTANDAYISYDPADPEPEVVPHYGSVMIHPNLNVVMHRFSRIWHDACVKDNLNGLFTDCLDNNILHLVGMEQTGAANFFGSTNHKGNSSLVFQGAIMSANATRSTTRHEIVGHQHEVNPCDLRYHDTNNAWCDNPDHCGIGGAIAVQCLMSETRDRELGVDRLDTRDIFDGISAQCTDTQIVPNEVHNPPDGSIRKDRDPR